GDALEADVAAVTSGDLATDRQAEARAASASLAAAKALKDERCLVGSEAGPVVTHFEQRAAVLRAQRDPHRGRGGVAERVVDEIQKKSPEQARYAAHADARLERRDEATASLADHWLELGGRLPNELVERNVLLLDLEACGLDRREGQQVLGEAAEPRALLDGVDEAPRRSLA